MAKVAGAEMDYYWPILESVFPLQVVSHLKSTLWSDGSDIYWTPYASTQTRKRVREDD